MKAKKALGQNFLVNPGIAPKILYEGGIDEEFGVLEIGPGRGALTSVLLKTVRKVVAVELDSDLIPTLESRFGEDRRFSLISGDVLTLDLRSVIDDVFLGMRCAVVGNLPYYITSPILMKLLEERLPVERIVVMVQKEAATRLAAPEGSRESGAVTLAVRYYSNPEILFDVAPGSFSPAPKVWSSAMLFRILDCPRVSPKDESLMFRVIRGAFSQRRKTAVNAVSASLGLPKDMVGIAFSALGFDPLVRAERLMLHDYVALSDYLADMDY